MLHNFRQRGLAWAVVALLLISQAGTLPSAIAQSGAQASNGPGTGTPVSTGFTYQGQLRGGSGAVNGTCDIAFRLFDALTSGNPVGSPLTPTVTVANGLFTTQLDFGAGMFDGNARWLDLQVRCGSDTVFTQLTPRQALTTAPYALYALNAATAGTANTANTAVSANAALTASAAPWSGLTGVPAGFADNVDNDTQYTAGSGLTLSGGQFSVVTSTIQTRITGSCGAGLYVQSINADGSVNCGTDAGTTYTAGAGIAITGTSISVTGAPWGGLTGVPAGFADNVDNDTQYTAGFGLTLNSGQFGVTTSTVQSRVTGSCGVGLYVQSINADGTVNCGTDADTTYTVSTGLFLTGTTFSLNTGYADGRYWQQGGSNVTNTTSYLGTSNNMTLTLAVNGTTALRLVPNNLGPSVLGGAAGNVISPSVIGGVIAGGGSTTQTNSLSASYSTIGGGVRNVISSTALYATLAGGYGNAAAGIGAVVGGGGTDGSTFDGNAALGNATTIGGGVGNYISPTASYVTIGGGGQNTAYSGYSTIGGGQQNTTNGILSTVGGGYGNIAGSSAATIAGGGYDGSLNPNQAYAIGSSIGGGAGNYISNTAFVGIIAGGQYNTLRGSFTTIGGGDFNQANGNGSTIAGGESNSTGSTATYSTIAGGKNNIANGRGAVVGGGGYDGSVGNGNEAYGDASTIGGGYGNIISATADYGFIGGGSNNTADGISSVVGGGSNNAASSTYTSVGGGVNNQATGRGATVGGGGYNGSVANGNKAQSDASTIAGGYGNSITGTSAIYAFIGGGNTNTINNGSGASLGGGAFNSVTGNNSTIAGGTLNQVSGRGSFIGGGGDNGVSTAGNSVFGDAATIAGGWGNSITTTADYGAVGGGAFNVVNGRGAVVAGGGADGASFAGNTAAGDASTIGGGFGNVVTTTADYGTIGGGSGNAANGAYATVPGGNLNQATGNYSLAAGRQARALHGGAFVWADSNGTPISSTVANQFLVRASGGTIIYSNGGATTGVSLPAGSGTWNSVSDRNLKANFSNVDSRAILAQVAALPIQTWNYTSQDATIRHIGPMAQDFSAAFNVGENNTSISVVDADGVALAAIQGLKQEKDEELAALQAQNAALEARLVALEQAQTQPTAPNAWLLLLVGVVLGLGGAGLAFTLKNRSGR